MIEIYLLEQLDAFKKCGTLRMAAEYLHMTQPSLTRSMQKIENILDTPILEHKGNRVFLNDVGEVVADYAAKILAQEQELTDHVNALKKSKNSLIIGSVAPGPLYKLLPAAMSSYSDMSITSEQADEETLIKELNASAYGVIILTHPLDDMMYYSTAYTTEQLYLSVSRMHPAATYKSVTFSDLNGQNFIMYSQVGIWAQVVKTYMPDSTFFEQSSLEAVSELAKHSELPSFSTNITLETFPARYNHRIQVPFSDPESRTEFYLICLKKNRRKWERLFS